MDVTFGGADSVGVDESTDVYSDQATEVLGRTSSVGTTCIGYESFHPQSPRPACYDLLRPQMESEARTLRDTIKSGSGEDLLQLLKGGGVDIDAQDQYGETALHLAASWGKGQMVGTLLSYGADPSIRDVEGRTALHCAARSCGPEVLPYFIDQGVDLNIESDRGQTALDIALSSRCSGMVRGLLDIGASVGSESNSIAFELQAAMQRFDEATAQAILSSSVDRAPLNMEGALHAAIRRPNPKGVLMLLDFGCSPNALNERGSSALGEALSWGLLEIASRLLVLGADPYHVGYHGQDAMDIALDRGGNRQAVELLLQSGVNPNGSGGRGVPYFFKSLNCRDSSIPLMIVRAGVDPNEEYQGESPLYATLLRGRDNEETALALLERGADPHWYRGFGIPLLFAMQSGYTRVIDALLDRNVDVNLAKDPKETHVHCHSPLCQLIRLHRNWDALTFTRLVQRMIDAGADVNASYLREGTVLMDAIRQRVCPQVISLLLEGGAKPDAIDGRGKSVLDYAVSSGDEGVVQIISGALEETRNSDSA